jgi:microcin C transport system substrate-binding protein
VSERNGTENPAALHFSLRRNPDYRRRFGDRVHRYFFNGGPFSVASHQQFYLARSAQIDKAIVAETRADLTFACRALDRVFRAGRYWVPQWFRTNHPIAYWDLFAHPPKPARYTQGTGAPDNWWYDGAKAAKLEQAK